VQEATRRTIGGVLVGGSLVGLIALGVALGGEYRDRLPAEDDGLSCCAPGAEPRRAPEARLPDTLDGGDVDAGRAVYVVACVGCHDTDGSGRRARARQPTVRDLRGLDGDPARVAEAVVHGAGPMPAFGGLLADDEVRDLVAFLGGLRAP
jgi:mono/diheme cytochrome c family protein